MKSYSNLSWYYLFSYFIYLIIYIMLPKYPPTSTVDLDLWSMGFPFDLPSSLNGPWAFQPQNTLTSLPGSNYLSDLTSHSLLVGW